MSILKHTNFPFGQLYADFRWKKRMDVAFSCRTDLFTCFFMTTSTALTLSHYLTLQQFLWQLRTKKASRPGEAPAAYYDDDEK